MEQLSMLLVEDDEVDAMVVRRLLERGLGSAKVTWKPTLAEAQQSISTEVFDVALLDLHLPDAVNDDAVVALRRSAPELPIVVLSGADDEHLVARMVRRGAEDYIPKADLDETSLRRGVLRAIELRAMRHRARLQREETRRLERLISGNARLHMIGSVAAGIADELASPAAYALLNLQLLVHELESRTDEDPSLIESARDALGGVQRMAALGRDLQPYNHVHDRDVENVALDEVYRSARIVLSGRFRNRITIRESLEETPPIPAMRGRLVHATIMVLSNVLDAFESLKVTDPTLEISTHAENGQVRLRIVENSKSLDIDASIDAGDVVLGLGLGSAVCEEIARAHRGSAELTVRGDDWGQFDLVLPFDTGLDLPDSADMTRPSNADRFRLLLVDDEALMVSALERALDDSFEVSAVPSVQDAFPMIDEQRPDVVMVDLGSGAIDGEGFWERMGAEHPELLSRTVFLSGGALNERTAKFFERDDVLAISRMTHAAAIAATLFDLVAG